MTDQHKPMTADRAKTEKQESEGNRSEIETWLAIRKEAGRKIDPETAEVYWEYGFAFDPYDFRAEAPQEERLVQRNYFARSPGSDIWVVFEDLPDSVRHRLWMKHKAKLDFPEVPPWL